MVNSALYNRLTTKGGKPMRHTGHHAFNLMVGGQKAGSSPFLNLLKRPQTTILLITIILSIVGFLSITLKAMLNI